MRFRTIGPDTATGRSEWPPFTCVRSLSMSPPFGRAWSSPFTRIAEGAERKSASTKAPLTSADGQGMTFPICALRPVELG